LPCRYSTICRAMRQISPLRPTWLVETFVERERFAGICYKAANWKYVGSTKGRSRQDRYNSLIVPDKDIYLYPLVKKFQEKLCDENP